MLNKTHILISTLSLVSITALAKPQQPDPKELQKWKDTQVDFAEVVTPYIENSKCKSSPKDYVACVAVANLLYKFSTGDYAKNVLVDMDNNGKLVTKSHSDYKEYLHGLYDQVESLENNGELGQLNSNFDGKINQFKKNHVTDKNESYYAAKIYNKHISIAEDPHSYLMPSSVFDDYTAPKDKKAFGIDFQIDINSDGETEIKVTSTNIQGPAAKAGIQRGDIITQVNDQTSREGILAELTDLDTVDITLLRANEELKVQLTKKAFKIHNVIAGNAKINNRDNYGILKLRNFMEQRTCRDLVNSAIDLRFRQNVKGVILDLRGNGGGSVSQAQCILQLFLEAGSISFMTREIGADYFNVSKIPEHNRNRTRVFQDMNNVVLVDGASASASEVMAIYLRDYRKAFIVGETTFGKGSMQLIKPKLRDSKNKKQDTLLEGVTQALYYGPKGNSPQVVGVEPDIISYPWYTQTEETPTQREKDLYLFPIEDRDYNQNLILNKERMQDVEAVQNCVQEQGFVENAYNQLDAQKQAGFDNQLYTAVATLKCANDLNIKPYTGTNIPTVGDFRRVNIR